MNDILIRLQNGEKVEDILNEFANKVNEAEKIYQQEYVKMNEFKALVGSFYEFCAKYYGVQKTEELTDEDYADIMSQIEAYIEISKVFSGEAKSSAEDILRDWVNKI